MGWKADDMLQEGIETTKRWESLLQKKNGTMWSPVIIEL